MNKYKIWLIVFMVMAVITVSIIPIINIIVDPYGVFGDHVFNWYSYNMTQNPRAAKVAYLEKNHQKYEGYILGASGTSALSPIELEKYTGISWYNLFVYGADLSDTVDLARLTVDRYGAKEIILCLGFSAAEKYKLEKTALTQYMHPVADNSNAFTFYIKYLTAHPSYAIEKLRSREEDTLLPQQFDVFIPETGTYDKSERDVEYFGALENYFKQYPVFTEFQNWQHDLVYIDECVAAVRNIKDICENNSVKLTVVVAPIYLPDARGYAYNQVAELYSKLAEVTEYWDFAISSVSTDPRYFYDTTHFRNAVGDMMLARVFNNTDIYVPEDFGEMTNARNAIKRAEIFENLDLIEINAEEIKLPILMYHHIDEDLDSGMTVAPEKLSQQLDALENAGYTTISIKELLNYVKTGKNLPEKPILLTFDDGYLSNYSEAYPILREKNMKAAIFAVGITFGSETYKDTGVLIKPHFGSREAKEMTDSGLIEVYNHSYDMHNVVELDKVDFRLGIMRLEGESEIDYVKKFDDDVKKANEIIEAATGQKVIAYAYPYGLSTVLTESRLRELGISVTFTTEPGVNTIVRGLDQTLRGLSRFTVTNDMSGGDIINMIEKYE